MVAGAVRGGVALAFGAALVPWLAAAEGRRYKIGACDWSLGKLGEPASFEIARQVGLDGVQISLGTEADGMKLRKSEVQQQFKDAATKAGVEISGLAIGELNQIPYQTDARAEVWVSDGIGVMPTLGVKVMLVPFFGKADLVNNPAAADEVVRRLKKAAPKAVQLGVTLGLESWLSAADTMRILERVNSPSVKMYYDVANSTLRGYDIIREIRWLGKANICEFHLKENDYLLGRGKVDFVRVHEAINDIGYEGWLQIEGAIPPKAGVVESYTANVKFVRGLFAS